MRQSNISNIEWMLLIALALLFDAIQIFFGLISVLPLPVTAAISGIIGFVVELFGGEGLITVFALMSFFLIGNRLVSIIAWLSYYLYFKIKGIKKVNRWLIGGGCAEIIPFLGLLPFWTGTIIAIMVQEKMGQRINVITHLSKT